MKLSDKLDEITRKFWSVWRTWRLGQGWCQGSDLPSQKVCPHLVASFDQLTPDGSEWFRQHTALLLHSLDDLPLESWGFTSKPQAPTVVEGAEPRLRAEIEKLKSEAERLRHEANALRSEVQTLKVERDQEAQNTVEARYACAVMESKLKRKARPPRPDSMGAVKEEADDVKEEPEPAPPPAPVAPPSLKRKKSTSWG